MSVLSLGKDVDPEKVQGKQVLLLTSGNAVDIGGIRQWQTALAQVPVKCFFIVCEQHSDPK